MYQFTEQESLFLWNTELLSALKILCLRLFSVIVKMYILNKAEAGIWMLPAMYNIIVTTWIDVVCFHKAIIFERYLVLIYTKGQKICLHKDAYSYSFFHSAWAWQCFNNKWNCSDHFLLFCCHKACQFLQLHKKWGKHPFIISRSLKGMFVIIEVKKRLRKIFPRFHLIYTYL